MKKYIFLAFCCLFFAGCASMSPISQVPTSEPINFAHNANTSIIELKKVVCDIEIGKTVGGQEYATGGGGPVKFNAADSALFIQFLKTSFYKEAEITGYKTLGGTDDLFDEYSVNSAEFIIAARIKDIVQNRYMVVFSMPDKVRIQQYVKVNWQVFSRQRKAVVGEFFSEGYDEETMLYSEHPTGVISKAFANSVKNLFARQDFVDLITGTLADNVNAGTSNDNIKFQRVSIRKLPKSDVSVNLNSSAIRASVITVKSSKGLGSSFIISADGYALTNAHVVGSDSMVKVKLATGRECLADVLYRESERDVAMIKIEQVGLVPLPINTGIIKVGDEVYAMGSPLDESLSSTLTKGIVSAFRKTKEGLEYIQSDVSVQPGNSGGPLMDEYGNVVGITVSGVTFAGEISMGLNFFIPINDAIKSVGIVLTE